MTVTEKRSRLNELLRKYRDQGRSSLTPEERSEFVRLDDELSVYETRDIDTRGVNTSGRREPAAGEIRGELGEPVAAGKAREWYRKAQENGVRDAHGVKLSSHGTDVDLNAYWGQRFGFAKPGAEMRALGEDTAGSAQAITPQAWSPEFVDVLLPNTIVGKVGARHVMMDKETMNVPVFTSTVSPTWIAEAGSISLDANPAFSSLSLFAPGGVKDITNLSIELAQDAYIQGGLHNMLAEAVAKKMAVVVDTAALLGISGNTGVPGLNGESGFNIRHYTGDAGTSGTAPADTTELGVVAEESMKLNVPVDELAFVSNVGVNQAFTRIPLATYGRYFELPPLVDDVPWVTSENSALPYTEDDPATASSVAQTGGTYSSLYCGPWSRFAMVGWHMELRTQVLNERYIDTGEIGLFSWCRFSIRYAHPETFSRTVGVIPV